MHDAPSTAGTLRSRLLSWYGRARRDLPWRRTRDPYAVWLSETMLQQTRVDTVIPYYERFLRELPTVHALAEAPEQRVLALWSGLGYYRRARMLHAAAKRVAGSYDGRLPSEPETLRTLEGVGEYTAGAVASIAFGRRAALVDGNVARVLARLFAIEDDVKSGKGKARVWRVAEELVADLAEGKDDPGDWNQALMELGATVCVPRQPSCEACPVREPCAARARGIVHELPKVAIKKKPRPVARVALVLASEHAVLLARRRPGLLFGGMWEVPGAGVGVGAGEVRGVEEAENEAVVALASRLGVDITLGTMDVPGPRGSSVRPGGHLQPVGRVVHVLSHRRLEIGVFLGALPARSRRTWPLPGDDYDAVETVTFARLPDLPHAALTKKVLAVAKAPVRGLPLRIT